MSKPSVVTVVKNSYRFLWSNKPYFWSVVKPIIPFYALYGVCIYLMPTIFERQLQGPPRLHLASALLMFVGLIVTFPASVSLSVSWYRGYLLGTTSASLVGPLQLKKPHWEFLGKRIAWMCLFIAMLTIIVVATVILSLVAKSMHMPLLMIPIILAMLASIAACLCYMMRLNLYFPAKASGDYLSFADARRRGKGTGRSMMLAALLTELPILIASGVISVMTQHELHGLAVQPAKPFALTIASLVLNVVIAPVFALMCVTNVAQYYQWVRGRGVAVATYG